MRASNPDRGLATRFLIVDSLAELMDYSMRCEDILRARTHAPQQSRGGPIVEVCLRLGSFLGVRVDSQTGAAAFERLLALPDNRPYLVEREPATGARG